MAKTECGTVHSVAAREAPEQLRLKAELLACLSCVQNQQQKLNKRQEGTEALGQKTFPEQGAVSYR